jgi:hypothetical protein
MKGTYLGGASDSGRVVFTKVGGEEKFVDREHRSENYRQETPWKRQPRPTWRGRPLL